MPVASQSSVIQSAFASEVHVNSDEEATQYIVQDADQAVHSALRHGPGALTTEVHDRDTKSETLPAFFSREVEQAVHSALKHGPSTLTTEVHDRDTKSETLPAFPGREQDNVGLADIVHLPPPQPRWTPADTLHPLQEWEGYVVEIGATDFMARLVDLTAGSTHEEEEAVIPLAEISDNDADRICAGSIFRWVIGYQRSPAGTKKRVSYFVFRDLPAITETDLHDGEAWALETIRSLGL